MKASFEEIVGHASRLLVFERCEFAFLSHWHYHSEFELTLILDSQGQRLVGDCIQGYGPGDLVLIGPNLPHTWRSTSSDPKRQLHRAVVTQFRGDFLGDRLHQARELHEVAQLLLRARRGIAFGNTPIGRTVAKYLADLPTLSPARQLVTLLSALVDLAEERQGAVLASSGPQSFPRTASKRRIDNIYQYLDQHFNEDVDFARLSSQVHMDQASLCRFFKRTTGRTMTEYINELRIAEATKCLIETDESLIDICYRVGFGNYAHFNRQFKRIKGCNPALLRKEFSLHGASGWSSMEQLKKGLHEGRSPAGITGCAPS